MIERSLVRAPAGAAGEFSSLGSTFCADSLFRYPFHSHVTAVACKISPVILPKLQVAGYSYTHMHPTYVALHEVP